MTLDVIGAGLSRTGTMSLALALEGLGFEPCYHAENSVAGEQAWRRWEIALGGGQFSWEDIFAGFRATTDIPGCLFYRELAAAYPSAKIILTLRDPDQWFKSTRAILAPSVLSTLRVYPMWRMWERALAMAFGDRLDDRAALVAAYERHNAEVVRSIPSARLLVYQVREGWEPLCNFLQVDKPEMAFPRVNARENVAVDPGTIHRFVEELYGIPSSMKEYRKRVLGIA